MVMVLALVFSLGVVSGGYLFSDSRPRSFLAFNRCEKCLGTTELIGLMASVGIQKTGGAIPFKVMETDKTIVIRHPLSKMRIHYVIIPKKDIRDVGDLSAEDTDYLIDMYAVATELIRKERLSRYRLYTNGPGYQAVGYLHFHLIAN